MLGCWDARNVALWGSWKLGKDVIIYLSVLRVVCPEYPWRLFGKKFQRFPRCCMGGH